MASLDVESLLTKVPIMKTIDILLDNCYNHPTLMKPKMSKQDLKELLIKCTTKAPFRHIDDNVYYQTEGIAMGKFIRSHFCKFLYVSHCNLIFK